jgi:transposase
MRSRRVPTVPPLTITEEERAELLRRVRAHTTPQRAAQRTRIVLLAADGLPNRQIAPIVGMNQHTVAQWRRRFEAERLAGLTDRKRSGRPLVYGHDQRLRIVATVTQEPPDPASHWSRSQLAKVLADMGISASRVGRILADLDIKPHRVRSWITRPDDPGFWERAADICGLYLVPPTNVARDTRWWFVDHPRFHPHYTPSHASWLNQVELFFSILARRLLKRGEFASVEDLVGKVMAFIADYNRTARPFRWTYDGRPLKAS